MKNSALWVFVLLVVAAVGWYVWSAQGKEKMMVAPTTVTTTPAATSPGTKISPTPTVPPKTINMEQVKVSGQSGTAMFQDEGGKTKVTLTMIGKKYTAPQPAHIHVGKCPTPGEVKYPLNNVVDGKSETVISVSIEDLFADLPLAVNVHDSVEKASVYTACGDLE